MEKHAPGLFVLLVLLSAVWLLCPASGYSLTAARHSAEEEFAGPFLSWASVKDYGAVGDGKADDTAAIQKALEAVRSKDSASRVLYFPAGTYRITATLKLDRISHSEPLGMSGGLKSQSQLMGGFSSKKTSAGVLKPRHLRGRLLSSFSTCRTWLWEMSRKSVPLGKY